MPLTVEQYLDLGFAAFDMGVGSAPYDANIEAQWKNLFRDKITWNLAKVPDKQADLIDLATWMGENAASQPSLDGWIHLEQLVASFLAVRVEGYHRNGDHPTIFC